MKYNLVPIWTPLYWHRKLLYQCIEGLVARLAGGSVLDVGCGSQPYREIFERMGIEYSGADIDSGNETIVQIDPVSETILANDESYDSISHFQVMEHVPDHIAFLGECFRVLKKGANLVATVPFAFEYHAVPNDYRRWTHEGLRHDFESAGFEVLEVGPVEKDWASLAVINQLHIANLAGLKWTKPIYLIVNLLVFLLKWGPSRIPLTNWIVCRKPD